MREIKFRARDTLTKRWFSSLLLRPDGTFRVQRITGSSAADKPDRWILCLFTGLRDKNGNEIYEGDVVQLEQNEGIDDFPHWVKHKAKVYYDDGGIPQCL